MNRLELEARFAEKSENVGCASSYLQLPESEVLKTVEPRDIH